MDILEEVLAILSEKQHIGGISEAQEKLLKEAWGVQRLDKEVKETWMIAALMRMNKNLIEILKRIESKQP